MTSEQALRRMRQRIFLYPDEKEAQADRVIHYLKKRMLRYMTRRSEPVGPYNGMTRGELSKTRTCETDWY